MMRRLPSSCGGYIRGIMKRFFSYKNRVFFWLLVFCDSPEWDAICHTCSTKIGTSAVSAGCYLSTHIRTALCALTEKQPSINSKSAVINSSMTGGMECFQSFEITLISNCHFLFKAQAIRQVWRTRLLSEL